MKLIVAVVRPFTVEKLVVAFEDITDFPGMTMTDAAGFGRGLRSAETDPVDPFRRNRRIEIICDDELAEQVVTVIRKVAHTGKRGDGIIYVVPIEKWAGI